MREETVDVLLAMNKNLHRIALSLEKILVMAEAERIEVQEGEEWTPSGYEYGSGEDD